MRSRIKQGGRPQKSTGTPGELKTFIDNGRLVTGEVSREDFVLFQTLLERPVLCGVLETCERI